MDAKGTDALADGLAALSAWLERQLAQSRHLRWMVALLLAVTVLAPYHSVVTGRALPIPDDVFASDLADGEFPLHVEAGRVARAGELPFWTPRVLTGLPMVVDPYSVALFAVFPPAVALGLLLGTLLAGAALGMYVLARLLGASRSGAFLSGFAFAWSGFFVCQLRHLGVLGTVAFLPWAVYCLEQAACGRAATVAEARAMDPRRRLLWLAAFGAVFGMQCLAAFPQSAYISALFYAALVVVRARWLLDLQRPLPLFLRYRSAVVLSGGALIAVAAGGLIGMMELLPLHELGMLSPRSQGSSYEWATFFKYYVPNVFTFLMPYINGDISDLTYRGKSIFWEDYGYVGIVPFLAGFVAVGLCLKRFLQRRCGLIAADQPRAENQDAVFFWAIAGTVAYVLVLGSATGLYWLAYQVVPGLKTFRFPTRFLFVVEFAIALLGGLGLTYFQAFAARRVPAARRAAVGTLVGLLFAGITVFDLVWFNKRQNPLVDSKPWLSAPFSATLIQQGREEGRVYTPQARERHTNAFVAARGWRDLVPYYLHREALQPNANLLHGLASLNAYSGISPTWSVDLIGDHNQEGLVDKLVTAWDNQKPCYYNWLEALSVRWLLASGPVDTNRATRLGGIEGYPVYRLNRTLPRARFVERARVVPSPEELLRCSLNGSFDPRREAALQTAEDLRRVEEAQTGTPDGVATARIVVDRATEVVVEASSTSGGLLVLSDTYYPGWNATVDGRAAAILRVNLAHRGVALAPGTHRISFVYRSPAVRRGLLLTAVGAGFLAGVALLLLVSLRRTRPDGVTAG